jgi:non-specific serine/threonine protein kinase
LVPNELAQRLAPLLALGTEQGGRLRYAGAQTAIVDQLLQEATQATADAAFEQRREQLRWFEHIEAEPLPTGFQGVLRHYQKAGYDWLHFLNRYGFGGCLADDMGVGKTIQTLAFIQSLRERAPGAPAVLIVLPRSLVYNWMREAAQFTPGLRLLTHIDQGRSKSTSVFDGYDVVLTTYGTMLRDIDLLATYRFQYLILDESQAIKNPAAETARAVRRLNGERRLSLTGTPIENNAYELWSQFAFLNPGLLGSAEAFRETFARDGEQRAAAIQLLRRLTFPFILRRTKAQVAPDLPSRTEHVLMCEMDTEQRRLYVTQRDHYRALLLGMIDNGGPQQARVKMLEGLLRLRQICNHPRLIDANSAGTSGKFDELLATLESLRVAGHRVLVFSQFVQMLTLVRAALDERGIAYAYLDGRTRDRQSIIDAFQNDTRYPFFLISLRAGGVGLNLTAADYVIHIDPWWNPAVEMQATDRTHRIGQTRPVMVYKMVVRDSVEEKILQLQERKRELVSQLITPERGGVKTLTRADVELLFT